MALLLGAHVHDLHRAGPLSAISFANWFVILVLFVSSIVGGRLYISTHGFLDITVEVILRITGWVLQRLVMSEVERTAVGPRVPSPVDDYFCFEGAVALVSVILGEITSFWCSKRLPDLNADLFTSKAPGGAFDSPIAKTTWMLFALLKLTTGILIILAWCMLAKPTVQTLLPPLFRWLALASPVRLPHRRHYTPATEYSRGPPHTVRAMPSMIDFDLAVAEVVDWGSGGIASGRGGRTAGVGAGAFKRRGLPSEDAQEKAVVFEVREGDTLEDDDKVKRYDADVLTKVDVYSGIGVLAAVILPGMFEALE